MPKYTPKYLMSKPTALPTKLGGSKKKDAAAQQNQINLDWLA